MRFSSLQKNREGISAGNVLRGTVRSLDFIDGEALLTVLAGEEFLVRVTAVAVARLGLKENSPVYLIIKARSCREFESATSDLLDSRDSPRQIGRLDASSIAKSCAKRSHHENIAPLAYVFFCHRPSIITDFRWRSETRHSRNGKKPSKPPRRKASSSRRSPPAPSCAKRSRRSFPKRLSRHRARIHQRARTVQCRQDRRRTRRRRALL